jgi:AcrR family transcriptional regulator
MPRPRKATDEEIFAALRSVIGRLGPTEWTLADVAAKAGLSASALVQRFGSKQALMVVATEGLAESTSSHFAALRSRHASPLAAVYAYGRQMARMAATPGTLAHHLSYLQRDLLEPELHANVRRQARETRRQLRALLADAVSAGELRRGCDPAALARTVEVVINGALLTWALHTDGTAATLLARELESVLRPVLPRQRRAAKASGAGPPKRRR